MLSFIRFVVLIFLVSFEYILCQSLKFCLLIFVSQERTFNLQSLSTFAHILKSNSIHRILAFFLSKKHALVFGFLVPFLCLVIFFQFWFIKCYASVSSQIKVNCVHENVVSLSVNTSYAQIRSITEV